MDAFGTHTGRRLALASDFIPDADGRDARFTRTDDGEVDVREPNPELPDGEVDLLVYITATVQVTVATPYTADELEAIAAHELGWNAEFVSVDRVEVDRGSRAPVDFAPAAGRRRHHAGPRRWFRGGTA